MGAQYNCSQPEKSKFSLSIGIKKKREIIMSSRAQLNARANQVGLDPSTIANDSKLESRILYLEKNATAETGTISTTTLTSDTTAPSDGDSVTFTLPVGAKVYTFKTALTEAAATGTLSTTGVFSDGENIVIDGVVYIMRTTLTTGSQQQNEVLIGAAATNSLDNLKATINGTGQGSTTNLATYAHPTCIATTKTSSSLVVTAKRVGTYGNSFATVTSAANATWGSATLTSGAAPVANQVLIGVSAATALSNLKAAVEDTGTSGTNYSSNTAQYQHVTASTLASSTLVFNARYFAFANADIGTTTQAAGSNHLSFTSSVMASGVSKVVAGTSTNDQISGANIGS